MGESSYLIRLARVCFLWIRVSSVRYPPSRTLHSHTASATRSHLVTVWRTSEHARVTVSHGRSTDCAEGPNYWLQLELVESSALVRVKCTLHSSRYSRLARYCTVRHRVNATRAWLFCQTPSRVVITPTRIAWVEKIQLVPSLKTMH